MYVYGKSSRKTIYKCVYTHFTYTQTTDIYVFVFTQENSMMETLLLDYLQSHFRSRQTETQSCYFK